MLASRGLGGAASHLPTPNGPLFAPEPQVSPRGRGHSLFQDNVEPPASHPQALGAHGDPTLYAGILVSPSLCVEGSGGLCWGWRGAAWATWGHPVCVPAELAKKHLPAPLAVS